MSVRRSMFKDVEVNTFSIKLYEITGEAEKVLIEITHRDMPVSKSFKDDLFSLNNHLKDVVFTV
jgi:hypothetical protein